MMKPMGVKKRHRQPSPVSMRSPAVSDKCFLSFFVLSHAFSIPSMSSAGAVNTSRIGAHAARIVQDLGMGFAFVSLIIRNAMK